jgi:hypothetical protein
MGLNIKKEKGKTGTYASQFFNEKLQIPVRPRIRIRSYEIRARPFPNEIPDHVNINSNFKVKLPSSVGTETPPENAATPQKIYVVHVLNSFRPILQTHL